VAVRRNLIIGGLVLAAGLVVLLVLRPEAILVETARVERGALQVTIDEDGETRVRDRFVVSAPVAGRLVRIELREGDPVEVNQVLAVIAPLPLNVREREEQVARVAAAEALQHEAEERVRRVQAEFDQTRRDRQRAEQLVKEGYATQQTLERARVAETTSAKELQAARFLTQSAASQVNLARAGLLALETSNGKDEHLVSVRSPATGRVLHLTEKSERVVTAGAPLFTVGDPSRLEIVVDVLSADAVKIAEGMPVWLDNWGGERPLRARVRTVEPAAFTKVSALGVEEQRVNIIADFIDSSEALGDGYRVDAHIVILQRDNVLKVPVSALFRQSHEWSVFVVAHGHARARAVEVGSRNAAEVEILRGLTAGEEVIRHPSNQMTDGARVAVRSE
jgi:HlyD family secretion protein